MSIASVDADVVELTVDQARALFDRRCREELGVSGDEFVERLDSDSIPADWSPEAVTRLEILLPFAR